jgi:outer membrane protein, heavy metal efflux system
MFRIIFIIFVFWLSSFPVIAQQLLTEADAVTKALANSKNILAASLQIKEQQQLVKSAINLPNPEFFWESPTGNFYTGSITQSIEFPSVYTRQYRLQKQQVLVAEKEKQLTEADIRYRVKLLYLEAQFADSLVSQLYIQDTLYEKIKLSAIRQFDAGQIDYLQQTFAETQYGEIHNQYLQSSIRARSLKAQLQWITGISEAIYLSPIVVNTWQAPFNIIPDSLQLVSHPEIRLFQQKQLVAKQNISLQKSKALPGLAFGYFNQGERDTKWSNRFRFGITLPLWFGQYKANINAAKTEQLVLQSKQEGVQQELSFQLINASGEMKLNWESLQYYRNTGIPKAGEVIKTSQRFFASGEIDYVSLLRNSNEAYNIFQKYLEAIRNYNRSIINYNYLTGQL